MPKRNLPVPYNPSGYNLNEDTPDHSKRPESYVLVIEKAADVPVENMAALLFEEFNWSAGAASSVLNSMCPGQLVLLSPETTFEICDHKGTKLHEKMEQYKAIYPELNAFSILAIPKSRLQI